MKYLLTLTLALGTFFFTSCGGEASEVNKHAYANIANGMTKAQVEELLGEKQDKPFTTNTADTTYRWWDGAGYSIYVTFANGVVTKKKEADINDK